MTYDVSPDGIRYSPPPWLSELRNDTALAADWPPACYDHCGILIKGVKASMGVDVDVHHQPPADLTMWTEARVCPHGYRYWSEPTADQFRDWSRELHNQERGGPHRGITSI